jgi:hypothetical protein
MQIKKVFVNDALVGEASTWSEVYRLLRAKGVRFIGGAGVAEGPTAFFLNGAVASPREDQSEAVDGVA